MYAQANGTGTHVTQTRTMPQDETIIAVAWHCIPSINDTSWGNGGYFHAGLMVGTGFDVIQTSNDQLISMFMFNGFSLTNFNFAGPIRWPVKRNDTLKLYTFLLDGDMVATITLDVLVYFE